MMPTETEIKIDTPLEGVQVTEPEVEWTAENEVNLFYAMRGRRPVGTQRFFQMYFIVEKFSELMQKEIASQEIWDHLEEMYDMDALNQNNETPQIKKTIDFELPSEFDELIEKKPFIEENTTMNSDVEPVVEKDKIPDPQPTIVSKPVSLLKTESSSAKVPKTSKEGPRRDSESKGAGDQETPKVKKPRQGKNDSLIKPPNPSSSTKKRRVKTEN